MSKVIKNEDFKRENVISRKYDTKPIFSTGLYEIIYLCALTNKNSIKLRTIKIYSQTLCVIDSLNYDYFK